MFLIEAPWFKRSFDRNASNEYVLFVLCVYTHTHQHTVDSMKCIKTIKQPSTRSLPPPSPLSHYPFVFFSPLLFQSRARKHHSLTHIHAVCVCVLQLFDQAPPNQ